MSDPVDAALGKGTLALMSIGLAASTVDGSGSTLAQIAGWIERIGLPTALVCGFAWASYRVIRWLADHVVLPLVARAVKLFDTVQASQETLQASSQSQAAALALCTEHMGQIARSEATTLELVQKLAEDAARDREAHREVLASLDGLRLAIDTLTSTARGNTPDPRNKP